MQQWLLARSEIDIFSGAALWCHIPNWMDRVDSMKQLQAWTDVTVIYFRDLGVLRRANSAFHSLRSMDND